MPTPSQKQKAPQKPQPKARELKKTHDQTAKQPSRHSPIAGNTRRPASTAARELRAAAHPAALLVAAAAGLELAPRTAALDAPAALGLMIALHPVCRNTSPAAAMFAAGHTLLLALAAILKAAGSLPEQAYQGTGAAACLYAARTILL